MNIKPIEVTIKELFEGYADKSVNGKCPYFRILVKSKSLEGA